MDVSRGSPNVGVIILTGEENGWAEQSGGEFLLKFDLGLSSLDLVILHGLGRQLKFFMFKLSDFKFVKCGDGGAQVSGHSFRGPYQG